LSILSGGFPADDDVYGYGEHTVSTQPACGRCGAYLNLWSNRGGKIDLTGHAGRADAPLPQCTGVCL
ncbi:hypothetical protein P3584_25705, partial [Vibrio parahaemolyticus]|nr:hypothetical protein [Vibrio parahaemolyticus]